MEKKNVPVEMDDDALEMAAGGAPVKVSSYLGMNKLQCPDCGTVIESTFNKNITCPDCGNVPAWIVIGQTRWN